MSHSQSFLSLLIYFFTENFTGQGENVTEMYNSDSGEEFKKKQKKKQCVLTWQQLNSRKLTGNKCEKSERSAGGEWPQMLAFF